MAGLMNPGLKSPNESGAFFRWTEVQLPPAEAGGSHRDAKRCPTEMRSAAPTEMRSAAPTEMRSAAPIEMQERCSYRRGSPA
jgi:hypothetical protein